MTSNAQRTLPKQPLDHEPAAVTYAREQAGLTKTHLAQACDVSLSLISEIEAGTRNATPAMLGKTRRRPQLPPRHPRTQASVTHASRAT